MNKSHKSKSILQVASGIGLAMELIGGTWKIEILWQLRGGATRYGVLKHRVTPISDRMLSQSLKEMEAAGLVHREVFPEVPPRVFYRLTPDCDELIPILQKLDMWGLRRMVEKAKQAIEPGGGIPEEHIEWS